MGSTSIADTVAPLTTVVKARSSVPSATVVNERSRATFLPPAAAAVGRCDRT
jgi:hypothetical protein